MTKIAIMQPHFFPWGGYFQLINSCDYFVVLLHEDPTIERPEKMKPILTVDERREILFALDIDTVISYNTESELYHMLKDSNYDVRFLGSDYIGKDFTGRDLPIKIHYICRDHDWSTTKFKKLIADEVQRSSNI